MPGATSGDPASPKPRVLVVDDHLDTVELLQMLLGRRGYDVTTADSVATALASVRETPVELLVSDITLPDGSGHDLLREMRATMDVHAVALSGLDRAIDQERAKAAGFDAYLSKPVTIDELVDALHRVSHV